MNCEDFQGTSVVNFPEKKYKFTRIHEPRHLHIERNYGKKTLIIKEFPTIDNNEPYYPINDIQNRSRHKKYKDFLNKDNKKLIFGGRLADYAYYDMDISAALKKFDFIKRNFKINFCFFHYAKLNNFLNFPIFIVEFSGRLFLLILRTFFYFYYYFLQNYKLIALDHLCLLLLLI